MKQFIIQLIIISILVSCNAKSKTEEKAAESSNQTTVQLTPTQAKNAGITTSALQYQEISSVLRLNGIIDVPPQNLVSISAPLGGYLKNSKLLPGMHVAKGEILAVMEDLQYIQLQQDYLTAKANIAYLENEYKRQKELNQSQASSDKVFQKADADYRSQLVLIASLAQKLALAGIKTDKLNETNISRTINIYSPIDGYISKVNVNIGKYISPTEVMFELINPTDIHLAVKVFEKDLNKLFIGQSLYAFTNTQPEVKHPCKIILIGKDLTAERNTVVHCHFEDYDKTLVPGTYMNAEIQINNTKTSVLPNDAIVRFEGRHFVFKAIKPNMYEMQEVNIGASENGFTEIIFPENNQNENAQYVTKGAYTLLMMMKNTQE